MTCAESVFDGEEERPLDPLPSLMRINYRSAGRQGKSEGFILQGSQIGEAPSELSEHSPVSKRPADGKDRGQDFGVAVLSHHARRTARL